MNPNPFVVVGKGRKKMKSKIFLAIVFAACVGVASAYEPCGVYQEVQPCAPIEAVQPCEPVQACAPVEAIQPCEPVQACAPVAACADCVAINVACENCTCKATRVALLRNIFERRVRIETSVGQRQCCLARIFARKSVSIERKVKIETN